MPEQFRFYLDQCMRSEVAEALRGEGYDVVRASGWSDHFTSILERTINLYMDWLKSTGARLESKIEEVAHKRYWARSGQTRGQGSFESYLSPCGKSDKGRR